MLGLQTEATHFLSEGPEAFMMTSPLKSKDLLVQNSSSHLLGLTVSSADGLYRMPAPVVLEAWYPDHQQPSPCQKYQWSGLTADLLDGELWGWGQHSLLS